MRGLGAREPPRGREPRRGRARTAGQNGLPCLAPTIPTTPSRSPRSRPEALDDAVTAAQKAFAAAGDLEALAAVRPAHLGDRAPVLLARRELGALPPAARSDAGKRVNAAREAVTAAYAARLAELEAERDARVLAEERVDVTLPWDRTPARRPAPADHADRPDRRHLRGHGLRGRRRPGARGGVAELRRAQHRPRPPGPHDDGHLLRRARRTPAWCCARTPARCRPARCSSGTPPIYVVAPGRVYRTDELDATHTPGLPPGRGPRGRPRADHGAPARHAGPPGPRRCSAPTRSPAGGRRTSRSPSRRRSSTSGSPSTATARAGSSGAAAGWSTRGC